MSSIGIEGTGFDKVYEKALSARERGEDEVECLDMEIVIGNQKYTLTIFPDSDPDALAQEFAVQHNLP